MFNRSSVFGQNHAFGSNPSQTSPFGSTFQQTQSTFGSNLCGSSPSFGGLSRPTFSYTSTSTPAFGMTGTSGFGATSTLVFGATSTPVFGSTNTPAFGSLTPAFGSTGSTFGQSSAPAFGSVGAFGTTTTRAFGASSTSALGAPSNAFSASTSSFGDSRSPSFNFGSCPFGESNSSFGSSPFGTTPLPFGAQSSPFGSQAASPVFGSPAFWQSIFGGQCEGSRVTSYRPTIKHKLFSKSAASKSDSSRIRVPRPRARGRTRLGLRRAAGSSVFGQNHAFGSNPSQPSPSGSTFQQTQSTFGSNLCGSSPSFGGPSRPTFGYTSTSTPAFGMTGTSGFGATSTPAFGSTSTPVFGSTNTPAFGSSTPAFGSTSSTFGQSSAPAFGSVGAFGTTTTCAFGASSTSALGAPCNAFGGSTSGIGDSRSPSFNFGSCPFGESNSSFGSSPFGNTQLPFGVQSSPFGSQATTSAFGDPTFWQSSFGGRCEGSRVASYLPTIDIDSCDMKVESISAMVAYKNKSHEELRWEDYRWGDKGGPGAAAQPAGGIGSGTSAAQPNPFEIPSIFGQFSTNSFSSASSSSPVTSTFESIPALDIDKSYEEFRWEVYKSGNKGGGRCVAQPVGSGGMGFGTPAAEPSPFGSSPCSICWSEPKEGVCVPCGHVTACMSCLNRIQNRKCPICCSSIQEVIKIFIA